MKSYLRKIIRKVYYKLKNYKHEKNISHREKVNKHLIDLKKTDFDRWKNNNELHENWNERTVILGNLIKPNTDIIEFGAGNMFLKYFLKTYKSYTPTDIIKRFDDTIVCDLNKPLSIDLSIFDTAVFSGVLEYVYDVDFVFNQLKNSDIKQIVMSYCCSDIVKLSRKKNGWLSDFTKEQLENIFRKYNYRIVHYSEWRKQSIYNLEKI